MRGSVIGEVIEGVVIGCVILFFCQRSGTWHCRAEQENLDIARGQTRP